MEEIEIDRFRGIYNHEIKIHLEGGASPVRRILARKAPLVDVKR